MHTPLHLVNQLVWGLGKILDLSVTLLRTGLEFPNSLDRASLQIDPPVSDANDNSDHHKDAPQHNQSPSGKRACHDTNTLVSLKALK